MMMRETWGAGPDKILGYHYNPGGLNNQKFALLGLFLAARAQHCPLILPHMSIKDIPANTDTPVAFERVFDLNPLAHLARQSQIPLILDDPSARPSGGWDYFGQGAARQSATAVHGRGEAEADFVLAFMAALRPNTALSALLARLKHEIYGKIDVRVAAQFRIEADWAAHARGHLAHTVPGREDYFIPFEHICGKIANTLYHEKNILVLCDERAAPQGKAEMRAIARALLGLNLYWKSDFISTDEMATLNPLELSIIDFELAVASKHFVGLTRSTFSNLVTFQKYANEGGKLVTTDYIYNNALDDELSLRTDNGGQPQPDDATRCAEPALVQTLRAVQLAG